MSDGVYELFPARDTEERNSEVKMAVLCKNDLFWGLNLVGLSGLTACSILQ